MRQPITKPFREAFRIQNKLIALAVSVYPAVDIISRFGVMRFRVSGEQVGQPIELMQPSGKLPGRRRRGPRPDIQHLSRKTKPARNSSADFSASPRVSEGLPA